MKKTLLLIILATMLLLTGSAFGDSITFTFANGQVTGSGPFFYEFDVMVAGGTGGTYFGDMMAYINYNTTAFGTNVVAGSKVTVVLGAALAGNGYFDAAILNDNTTSRFAITITFTESGPAHTGVSLVTTPIQWAHVKIQIANISASTDLSFQQSLMTDQQYEDDAATKYTPVVATDTDDHSLPVTMTSFTAETSSQKGITLSWHTESEMNTAGFNILRSVSNEKNYQKINNTLIPSQGNSSSACEYSFSDKNVRAGLNYWYKIEEVTTSNTSKFYLPIKAIGVNTIPEQFELSQNYPNPFNPKTTFKYLVAEDSDVTIGVYNLLGKEIKRLVAGNKTAGYYTAVWNGQDLHGRDAASGIYFIRMQAKTFSMVRKISLMR